MKLSTRFRPMPYPLSRKYSVDAEPLVPALKLSTKRTVLCSKGTVVPPDYKKNCKNGEQLEYKRKRNENRNTKMHCKAH